MYFKIEQFVALSGASDQSSAHVPITLKICYFCLFLLEKRLLKKIQFYYHTVQFQAKNKKPSDP